MMRPIKLLGMLIIDNRLKLKLRRASKVVVDNLLNNNDLLPINILLHSNNNNINISQNRYRLISLLRYLMVKHLILLRDKVDSSMPKDKRVWRILIRV